MTTEDINGVPDPGLTLVPGDGAPMESESSYRERELRYRCSEDYATMQKLYPRLRFWVSRCPGADLVGGTTERDGAPPLQSPVSIRWERSHGDC
jgi:hypothetical protein